MNGVLFYIVPAVIAAVFAPLTVWLLSRRTTNKQTNITQFTAITDAMNLRITQLENQVTELQEQSTTDQNTITVLQGRVTALTKAGIVKDRDMMRVKSILTNYLTAVSQAWGKTGPMPEPSKEDMAWLDLENTLPKEFFHDRQ